MVTDDDQVFKALADPTRRRLLDRLFERDGRTLSDLESDVDMTRFGVMKHLRLLEDAGLVTSRRSGREKLHFLNVVPIRLIHDRWIDKYTEPQVSALVDLKTELERTMTSTEATTATSTTVQVHRVYIKATAQDIWTAITDPEWTRRYGYRVPNHYDLRPGGTFQAIADQETPGMDAAVCMVEGEVLEVDAPHRLVQTWRPTWLDEPVTQLTYEIKECDNGVCSLTLSHDIHDAPQTAAQVAGQVENAGGGWPQVLSDLKSLLETGSSLFA